MSLYIRLLACIVMWLPVIGQANTRAGIPQIPEYMALYDQLMSLQPDMTKVADIQNLSIKRDVARFDLHEGEIYLLTPVYGRTVGAIFLGTGTAYAYPPTQIEREQFYRFYETHTLEKEFNVLFLLFADSTLAELEKKLSFGPGKLNKDAKEHVQYCLKYLSNSKGKYFITSVLKFIFENEQNSFFHAHFSADKYDPMCFRIDPYDVEEVRLMRRASIPSFYHRFETVCQFHKQADYLSGINLVDERKDLIKVIHYIIESTIKENLDFSAIAEVQFSTLRPNQDWIYFSIYSDMVLDSAFWEDGGKVNFFKHKNNSAIWIRCDTTLKKYDIRTLKLFYHGNLIDRNEFDWIYIKHPTGWYPRYGTNDSAIFDLTFHTPKEFTFVSVGKQLSSEIRGKMITTRWKTPKPIRNTSFNLGIYKAYEIKDERIPPVTVYMSKQGHRNIGYALGRAGITSGKNMERQVGADVANSLAFFQHVFGPSPVEQFYATETPYPHGLAFPGLIHLAWTTFQRTSDEGYDEIFRGHEVAHQWWGIEVEFKTYHDQWLSEGFATYAGLWYMQTVLQDNKKFFKILKEYRESILNNRKYLFGSGQEAGPIWLGYRTSGSKSEGDYNLIIYKKGALVLHMLRNMMIDLKTMNEDAFISMMRDFYRTYRGKKASTEDFRKIVEKHAGEDMNWFFNQWVYGTDEPTYRFSYKTELQKDGKYQVRCRVKQEEVADDFKMYVILKVDFGKKRYAYFRFLIYGPETDILLPPMSLKPKKVEFNALESVLCEVKKEKWSKK